MQYLVEQGADVTIRDNFHHRSPLEVAQYRQFGDVVAILSAAESQGRSKEAQRAARSPQEIEKEGRRKVFGGVHGKHKDLFLGRYRLGQGTADLITHFRQATANEGKQVGHLGLCCCDPKRAFVAQTSVTKPQTQS